MTWNYPDDFCCARCGSSPQGPSQEGEDGVDEFGRAKKPGSSSSKSPESPEWPPLFDSNGSAFVFDARSGMFYESKSDFFYDPKTKLYYGNKKKAYYRYSEDCKDRFEEVQKVDSGTVASSADLEAEPALKVPSVSDKSKDAGKKSISIKLKTKSLGKSNKPKPAAASEPPQFRQQKQHAVDIDKWVDRQIEKQVDNLQEREIQRTAKGEPICNLCRRKFPSVEKLLHHERVSTLHKENLAKAKAKELPKKTTVYVDRAQQRRAMHGPELSSLPLPTAEPSEPQTFPGSGDPDHHQAPPPQENLGETNIGNQLLQKMGWREGKGLGRPGSASSRVSSEVSLKKDWDRIEALAANGGRPSSTRSANSGLGS